MQSSFAFYVYSIDFALKLIREAYFQLHCSTVLFRHSKCTLDNLSTSNPLPTVSIYILWSISLTSSLSSLLGFRPGA